MSELTGKIRVRIGFNKKLIVQVEEDNQHTDWRDMSTTTFRIYRDAKIEDLTELDMLKLGE
jgi:hypothetical protein